MARQYKTFVSGTLGNVIFYEFRGKPVARMKPARVKQTDSTKESAGNFGRAVRMSKILRRELSPLLMFFRDKSSMYRLNTVLLKWLQQSKRDEMKLSDNLSLFSFYQFNERADLRKYLTIQPVVSFNEPGSISVIIPRIKPLVDIKAPENTGKIQLTILAVRCNTNDTNSGKPQPSPQHKIVLDLDYNSAVIEEQKFEFPFETMKEDIVLVAIGIHYWIADGVNLLPVMEEKWLPVGVVGVRYRVEDQQKADIL